MALGAQGVDLALVDGRRGPRAGPGDDLAEAGLVLVGPQLLAGRGAVADHHLLRAALLLGVQPIAHHRQRRPARPDALPPHEPGRLAVPVGADAHSGTPTVATGAAEAGPVARLHAQGAGVGRLSFHLASGNLFHGPGLVGQAPAPAPLHGETAVGAVNAERVAVAPAQQQHDHEPGPADRPGQHRRDQQPQHPGGGGQGQADEDRAEEAETRVRQQVGGEPAGQGNQQDQAAVQPAHPAGEQPPQGDPGRGHHRPPEQAEELGHRGRGEPARQGDGQPLQRHDDHPGPQPRPGQRHRGRDRGRRLVGGPGVRHGGRSGRQVRGAVVHGRASRRKVGTC